MVESLRRVVTAVALSPTPCASPKTFAAGRHRVKLFPMALPARVKAYFRAQAEAVQAPGFWSCLTAAETLAGRFLDAGRSPWIGRLRRSEPRGDHVFHAP